MSEQTSTPVAETETESRGLRKTRVGQVVGDAMDKTVVVSIVDLKQHPVYKKVVRRNKKLKAHDEKNECHVGDRVRIMETRPISKNKRWRVVEVVEKAR
ncbi:MAG: 30S ribosomal protein S17 [Candidatus Dormibacteria bacterium]